MEGREKQPVKSGRHKPVAGDGMNVGKRKKIRAHPKRGTRNRLGVNRKGRKSVEGGREYNLLGTKKKEITTRNRFNYPVEGVQKSTHRLPG